MKEVATEYKARTIAIDFDGVVHRYSKGFLGLDNIYDPPMPNVEAALQSLTAKGYRLIILSSRPVAPITAWLEKEGLLGYFDEITNIKQPAKYYIDDHAIHFDKNSDTAWAEVLDIITQGEDDE